MSMKEKLEHLKKDVRMLRDASIELYTDLDNEKWKAEQCADVANFQTSSSKQPANMQLKTD